MKNITLHPNTTIRQAMKKLDKTAEKCLLVTDGDMKLLGTLTDGDIRRSILAGKGFSKNVEGCYNSNPTVLTEGTFTNDEAIKLLRDQKLDLIPTVDNENRVTNFITWSNLGQNVEQSEESLVDIPVVIMAGGKGTRMEPFTTVLPKPLIPIHDKPIIEHIINKFVDLKCNEFYLTVNYKGRILKAFFEELEPEYNVSFLDETEPLGTAGALKFLKGKFSQSFFVTNCDTIIKTNFLKLHQFHEKASNDITLVASAKEFTIPYGTCELNAQGHLSHITEKPKFDFLVNTGLYVLNPDVLNLIPDNQFYHMTHLIKNAKDQGLKIGVFPIDEDSWIDIGQWAEYKKAVGRL